MADDPDLDALYAARKTPIRDITPFAQAATKLITRGPDIIDPNSMGRVVAEQHGNRPPLDELYRKGATGRIVEALTFRRSVPELSDPAWQSHGSVLVGDIEWKNGSTASIECFPDWVLWGSLKPTVKGLYAHLLTKTKPLFKDLGCRYYRASPQDDEAERWLVEHDPGWRPDPDFRYGGLILDL